MVKEFKEIKEETGQRRCKQANKRIRLCDELREDATNIQLN